MINPRSASPRIVFSSGNLSSGVVLHHENWHFLRVSAHDFARAHICLIDGMLDHYKRSKNTRLHQGVPRLREQGEESDLKTFFVPGDGSRAAGTSRKAFARRRSSDSSPTASRTASFAASSTDAPEARRPSRSSPSTTTSGGPGTVSNLPRTPPTSSSTCRPSAGGRRRPLHGDEQRRRTTSTTTSSWSSDGDKATACSRARATSPGTAFSDNFENFYYISVPHVVEAMKAQHEHLWSLATPAENLPKTNVQPSTN